MDACELLTPTRAQKALAGVQPERPEDPEGCVSRLAPPNQDDGDVSLQLAAKGNASESIPEAIARLKREAKFYEPVANLGDVAICYRTGLPGDVEVAVYRGTTLLLVGIETDTETPNCAAAVQLAREINAAVP